MADALDLIAADLELGDGDYTRMQLSGTGPDDAARLRDAQATTLLAIVPEPVDDAALARLRDAAWPARHITTIHRVEATGAIRRDMPHASSTLDVTGEPRPACAVLQAHTLAHAMGPAMTRTKFDKNAQGWNGNPGSPTYAHYRWMRRLLAEVARPKRGERALDAGCGTGWVGIEAGRMGAMVSAYDLSAQMVELAKQNAMSVGIDIDARVGFVEEIPFDHAFELVLNSGVISFAPDADVYLDALDRMVEPGGRLVIGDINPRSSGFRRRRAERPLLPARELNGLAREDVAQRLEARGYRIDTRRFYQLTFPVPELMAASETRMNGLGCGLLLACNKLAAGVDRLCGSPFEGRFDSWILAASKPS